MTFVYGTLFGVALAFVSFVCLGRYAPLSWMDRFLAAEEWVGSKLP